ncbi:hypothetical protein [uncultured Methanoregula sp.]|uniref:hypothetical protein n=1 Tax=uncultured Methanoregula sp. TaxID=1005933 RepID=UPI002AABF90C|nr:hypothetical protein [uncultured Methanoregula sp.]
MSKITLEHGLCIFIVIMFLIPCGMIVLISQEAAYVQIAGNPIEDAAQLTGITVTSVKDKTWNLPGATGGKIYVLADQDGNTLTIETQAFDSADARDAVVRSYNAHPVGRGKPVGGLVVIGQTVVYATPANSPILAKIVPVLKEKAGILPQGK